MRLINLNDFTEISLISPREVDSFELAEVEKDYPEKPNRESFAIKYNDKIYTIDRAGILFSRYELKGDRLFHKTKIEFYKIDPNDGRYRSFSLYFKTNEGAVVAMKAIQNTSTRFLDINQPIFNQ